jgi:RNA polymerase sigma-70 factor (ECF subfamily)
VSGSSDAALVRGAQRGSRAAAADLFERYWPQAWRAALAVTGSHASADDIAQDAFERAFAGLAGFDASRPFGPWLHRIVVNRAIDVLRRDRRRADLEETSQAASAESVGEAADPEALRALSTLSPERRAVVVLRHLLDFTPPEIAEILGIPVGTVNSRLGRALADLRARLEGGHE